MNEEEFWKLIESSGSPDKGSPGEQCERITNQLSGKSKEELVSFANIHKEMLSKAYTWPMLKASIIILSYISDDVFEDFRNWIILNGKQRFYETLEHPDNIGSYIQVQDPVEELTGEALLYVCDEAWDGDVEDLEEEYVYPEDPVIEDDWPSEEELKQEFPKLYDQFWDEENVRTLN